MDITIKINNNIEKIVQKNRMLWNFSSKKQYRNIIYYFLIGVGLLIFGIICKYTFRIISLDHNIKLYNINLSFSIGLAFILLSGISFYHLQVNRRAFFHDIDRYIHRINEYNCSIQINDTGVTYTDFELIQEVKWSKFSHYYHFKGFLFLMINGDIISSFIINKADLSSTDFSELLNFIKKKLIEKS